MNRSKMFVLPESLTLPVSGGLPTVPGRSTTLPDVMWTRKARRCPNRWAVGSGTNPTSEMSGCSWVIARNPARSLHIDQRLLAEPDRRLARPARQPASLPSQLHQRRPPRRRDHAVGRRVEPQPHPFRWTADPADILASVKRARDTLAHTHDNSVSDH